MEEDREKLKAKYSYPVRGLNWTAGVGQPAGMYWLEGRTVIAGHGTAAEAYLLAQGAVLAATLRFDPDPAERRFNGRIIDRVRAHALLVEAPDTPAGRL